MREELDEALCRDFPGLYADRHGDMRETAMVWGFACGDGWEPLIRRLSARLEPLGVVAIQVKEKFGTLRFYARGKEKPPKWWMRVHFFVRGYFFNRGWTPAAPRWKVWRWFRLPWSEADYWIAQAEMASERTCETCGRPGRLRTDRHWIQTMCEEHAIDGRPKNETD